MLNDREPNACMDRPGSLYLTGDGICSEIAPDVFFMHDDGLAYVQDEKMQYFGSGARANVPKNLEDAVREACEECPGECIFIEQD